MRHTCGGWGLCGSECPLGTHFGSRSLVWCMRFLLRWMNNIVLYSPSFMHCVQLVYGYRNHRRQCSPSRTGSRSRWRTRRRLWLSRGCPGRAVPRPCPRSSGCCTCRSRAGSCSRSARCCSSHSTRSSRCASRGLFASIPCAYVYSYSLLLLLLLLLTRFG